MNKITLLFCLTFLFFSCNNKSEVYYLEKEATLTGKLCQTSYFHPSKLFFSTYYLVLEKPITVKNSKIINSITLDNIYEVQVGFDLDKVKNHKKLLDSTITITGILIQGETIHHIKNVTLINSIEKIN